MAKWPLLGPAGMTVVARAKRDSDGQYWNAATNQWVASPVDNPCTFDTDMFYYVFDEDDPNFLTQILKITFLRDLGASQYTALGTTAFAPGDAPVIVSVDVSAGYVQHTQGYSQS